MDKATLPSSGNIAILNRGEAALRFIRAVKEFNILRKCQLKTVAFFLPEEEAAPFVQQADMAFSFSRLKGLGKIDRNVYLNFEQLGKSMELMNCIAAWVGWGFLSEEAEFIKFLEQRQIIFFGPPSGAVALLGDKIAAKRLAEQNNVPVTPWSKGAVISIEEARAFADAIGYPCMIKAALTGGGRGIRRVNSPKELQVKYESAREETIRVTGGAQLFIEQVVEKGRHLEVQALADRYGNVMTFGVRDCSVQRRNQKIIEETPPPNFDPEICRQMEECSMRLLKAAGYESAGTVEFLYDLNLQQYFFMEVNTRLQVEHPITEQAFAVDLVHGQLEVAMGLKLKEERLASRGTAVEVRLNAEDPDRGFTPAPGKVLHFQIPAGPGLRVDSGVSQGTTIPADFDSMIAKIIAFAPTRALAYARLNRALQELKIMIEGGTTNRAFLKALLDCPEIQQGGVHTRFVEELLERNSDIIGKPAWNIALLAAAIKQYLVQYREKQINFKQQLVGTGYPRELTVSEGLEINLRAKGQGYKFLVKATGPDQYLLQSNNLIIALEYHLKNPGAMLIAGNYYHSIQTVPRGSDLQIEVDGVPYLVELDAGGSVKAPSPAIVISLAVTPGQRIEKGQLLVVLEAMKMEMIVQAPDAGIIKEVTVRAGEQVAAGQVLLLIESGEHLNHESSGDTEVTEIDFAWLQNEDNEWKSIAKEYHSVFMGYDHNPSIERILTKALNYAQSPVQKEQLVELIITGLQAYVDIERLFFKTPVQLEKLSRLTPYRELLSHYFRRQANREKGLPESFLKDLTAAMDWYIPAGVETEARDDAVHHLYLSHNNLAAKQNLLQMSLNQLEKLPLPEDCLKELSDKLDELAYMSVETKPSLSDTAIHTRYQLIDNNQIQAWKKEKRDNMTKIFDRLVHYDKSSRIYTKLIDFIMENKYQLLYDLASKVYSGTRQESQLVLEILTRHMCSDRQFIRSEAFNLAEFPLYYCKACRQDKCYHTFLTILDADQLPFFLERWATYLVDQQMQEEGKPELIILINWKEGLEPEKLYAQLAANPLPVLWISLGLLYPGGKTVFHSYHYNDDGKWSEDTRKQEFSPRAFREFRIYRLANFDQQILYASEFVNLLLLKAKDNPRDERLYAMVQVPSSNYQADDEKHIVRMIALENVFMEAVYAMRAAQAKRQFRLHWNRIIIHIDAVLNITVEQNTAYTSRLIARAKDLGIERIVIYARSKAENAEGTEDIEIYFDHTASSSFTLHIQKPDNNPLLPTDSYATKVVRARQQNVIYPYELIKMITSSQNGKSDAFPKGEFIEYDIRIDPQETQQAVPVLGRLPGENTSNVIFGIITSYPASFTRGIKRVLLLSDSTRDMGSLTEAECRRIIAALDLAQAERVPLEWLPISAGARIDMFSGTENLDWTARVLRRIIEFTQKGGEINIIILGINIGAQSYWNAEATMLMHTCGLLMMSDTASMLLTGKKALDFSGSISAENNIAIGGVQQIMGPNGESQQRVQNIRGAYASLFRHYTLSYCQPGDRLPEPFSTKDPATRNICLTPYEDPLNQRFTNIGDIFSHALNPERKKPFDMRQLMHAVIDEDSPILERWKEMKDAEIAIVWEARIGGFAVGMIGIESRPLSRIGGIPHDGPESWSGGTLYPLSSKKIARGINTYSDKLPLVIMANLSGFDGSPESLRKLQLEYGAEIGRGIVNFRGPIFFIVTARYHGGAYVVFSKTLNPNLRIAAIEGAYASVIGGAPAAAVVFPRQVAKETYADPRIINQKKILDANPGVGQKEFDDLFQKVYTEKQGELAKLFDRTHSVERAKKVGSLDDIIKAEDLRPYLCDHLAKVYATSPPDNQNTNSMDISFG